MRAIRRTRMLRGGPPRWRVAILDGDVPSRAVLRTAVEEAGGVVAVEAPLRLDAVELMKQTRPDVVIIAPSLAGMREPALMPRITAGLDCPAVLFTRDTEPAVVRQANRAGMMAFMLKPLRAAELAPTLDLALARFRDLRRLQQARSDRPFVDRAKSKLMSDGRLSEGEAFRWLRRRAMDSRQRLGDVAREVLAGEAALESMEAGALTRRAPEPGLETFTRLERKFLLGPPCRRPDLGGSPEPRPTWRGGGAGPAGTHDAAHATRR